MTSVGESDLKAIADIIDRIANQRAVEIADAAPTVLDLGMRVRFSVGEVADMLGLSTGAVRDRIAAGQIDAVKDGRGFWITRYEVEVLAGYRVKGSHLRAV